jgi:hypothetical protein
MMAGNEVNFTNKADIRVPPYRQGSTRSGLKNMMTLSSGASTLSKASAVAHLESRNQVSESVLRN